MAAALEDGRKRRGEVVEEELGKGEELRKMKEERRRRRLRGIW